MQRLRGKADELCSEGLFRATTSIEVSVMVQSTPCNGLINALCMQLMQECNKDNIASIPSPLIF